MITCAHTHMHTHMRARAHTHVNGAELGEIWFFVHTQALRDKLTHRQTQIHTGKDTAVGRDPQTHTHTHTPF
jgi:hypothetical protein